ncbi:MAG TPA: CHASE4 domain-containing protein [Devosia sp.]|nr:CHASE4 domain-containing protein [Devosia sp.]
MASKRHQVSEWRFSYRVVLPVVLAVAVTVAAVAGFVYWSTARSDDRALDRQTRLIARAIDEQARLLADGQAYYSDWDEAITALRNNDTGWLDDNLGSDLFSRNHSDRIYVLSPQTRVIYAMFNGGRTAASRFEADRAAITRCSTSSAPSMRRAPSPPMTTATAATCPPSTTSSP